MSESTGESMAALRGVHSRDWRPDALEQVGRTVLASLASFLDLPLKPFREHYVREGSVVITFGCALPAGAALALQLEGVLMFGVRPPSEPPAVDADLLIFSHAQRLGLRGHGSGSVLRARYDWARQAWGGQGWDFDGDEDWSRITAPRSSEYGAVKKTFDF
jgi:hypothetical protein